MSSNWRRWAGQAGLLVGALSGAALLSEGLTRLVVNPVDFLLVDPVPDSVLRLRLEPRAGGHDAWGFRNRSVPTEAEIVTIGDSWTYGVGAPATASWPAQVSRLVRHSVYNLALGGYGPVQYEELLERHALGLRPKVVVVGIYLGNDLLDAYVTAYSLDRWAMLRRPDLPAVDGARFVTPLHARWLGPLRHWFATHSVLYRIATSTVLGALARQFEFGTRDHTGTTVVPFRHPVTGMRTGLTPTDRLRALDLSRPDVTEGLRLLLDRLDEMGQRCRNADVHLLVLLLPTKERVYEPWITSGVEDAAQEVFKQLFRHEGEVDSQIRRFLGERRIPYLDVTASMRAAAAEEAIFPPDEDVHPNAAGYAVIARVVAQAIGPWLGPTGAATQSSHAYQ